MVFMSVTELIFQWEMLELKLDAQQRQINELRELVLQLSKDIHSLQLEVSYLSNNKYKGL